MLMALKREIRRGNVDTKRRRRGKRGANVGEKEGKTVAKVTDNKIRTYKKEGDYSFNLLIGFSIFFQILDFSKFCFSRWCEKFS
tara:strand:- start:1456 stop:1707 length:252 start_codon:yes stop_codon:yes gene_type:complete